MRISLARLMRVEIAYDQGCFSSADTISRGWRGKEGFQTSGNLA